MFVWKEVSALMRQHEENINRVLPRLTELYAGFSHASHSRCGPCTSGSAQLPDSISHLASWYFGTTPMLAIGVRQKKKPMNIQFGLSWITCITSRRSVAAARQITRSRRRPGRAFCRFLANLLRGSTLARGRMWRITCRPRWFSVLLKNTNVITTEGGKSDPLLPLTAWRSRTAGRAAVRAPGIYLFLQLRDRGRGGHDSLPLFPSPLLLTLRRF